MRRDVFATADDDVFDTARQMQIAVWVEESFVASTKPSIHKSASVGLGIIFVSTKYICPLDRDLAALVGTEIIAFLVHDADAQPRAQADRTCFAVPRGQRVGRHLVSRLRHSVSFDEGYAEDILDLANEFRRQGRAAGAEEAQRRSFCGLVATAGH